MITRYAFIEIMPGQKVINNDDSKILKVVDIRQNHGITLEILIDTGEWLSIDNLDRCADFSIPQKHSYGFNDAMNDLMSVQLIDNTIDEAKIARDELITIIRGLCKG